VKTLERWLKHKWMILVHPEILQAYQRTFSTHDGQLILQHLLDHIYFTVYQGTDAAGAALHNARRSVVHEILMNIDAAENPQKYDVKVEKEKVDAP